MKRGVELLLQDLQAGEGDLRRELLAVGERHRTEHEIHHLAKDLARWCEQNSEAMAAYAREHGSAVADDVSDGSRGAFASTVREKAATMLGRRPEPGLLLLHDVRELYLLASRNSVNWTMLGQLAQAVRDRELLELVSTCHPRTVRQATWCTATLKSHCPQTLGDLG